MPGSLVKTAAVLLAALAPSSVTATVCDIYDASGTPCVAAHAMTVHRVQGATLSGPVHILLNKEFFAEGQAYVALSRVRRLSQLHLWCLERTAIVASPLMVAQSVI